MSAKRLSAMLEYHQEDARESTRFLSVQVRLWRSFSVIFSHHPELAKPVFIQMAINGTMVGKIENLQDLEKRVTKHAQSCGVTHGIFAPNPEIPQCTGLTMEQLWNE